MNRKGLTLPILHCLYPWVWSLNWSPGDHTVWPMKGFYVFMFLNCLKKKFFPQCLSNCLSFLCIKYPKKKQLKGREGLLWSTVQDYSPSSQQDFETSGHMASVTRNQRETYAHFSFSKNKSPDSWARECGIAFSTSVNVPQIVPL